MEVTVISNNMKRIKKVIKEVKHLQAIVLFDSYTSSNLVSQFLKSVVASPVKKVTKELVMVTNNEEEVRVIVVD